MDEGAKKQERQENYVSERIPGIAHGALYQLEANRSIFKTNVYSKRAVPNEKAFGSQTLSASWGPD